MSSTLRGSVRNKDDYYLTPVDEIQKFIKEFKKHECIGGYIIDPCAGGDDNHPMSYPLAFKKENLNIDLTIDKRYDSKADIKTDYLKYDISYRCQHDKPSMIITNPPFNIALPIINKALSEVEDGGFVIMLQRLNFLGSKSRFDFWKNNMPKYIFVHHKRMSFTGDGKTDSIEYCHYVWEKGYKGKFTKLMVI